MNIEITRELPEDLWSGYVSRHPEGNVFHTPEMFEVFRRTKNYRPELWAATGDDGVRALLAPVRITLMPRAVLASLTTRSVVYGSLLCSPGDGGQEAASLLLKSYVHGTRPRPLFTELRHLSDVGALRPAFALNGFKSQDHLNYLIDLDRPPGELFGAIGARTRKNIRHEINKKQVAIEEVKTREGLSACYALLCKTYGRATVPIADFSLFEAAFDVLVPKGMVRFSLATVGSSPAAASVDLLYKDVIYGWYGGIDRDFRKHAANELLTWDILRWGAENGYRVYDFGGAGDPGIEYGVRDFKAKFGGRLVSYGRHMCIHAPLRFRLSNFAYAILQPLLYGIGVRRRTVKLPVSGRDLEEDQ